MRYYDANNMPPTAYTMRHFKIFDIINSFLKNISNVLGSKKGGLHL